MDFSLNEEQRAWQLKAQNFANTEISPISLERDQIIDPAATFDWEIIKKGIPTWLPYGCGTTKIWRPRNRFCDPNFGDDRTFTW